MAYIILFIALAVWAWFALRDRPLVEYAAIYWVAEICSNLAEFTWSGVFRLYSYRSHLIADPFREGAFFLLFMGIEVAALHAGLAVYNHWNLGWAALNYAITLIAPMLYGRWLDRVHGTRRPGGIEPWEPPV